MSRGRSLLREEDGFPIGRDVGRNREIEPREIALLLVAGGQAAQVGPLLVGREEHAPVARDVVEGDPTGNPGDAAHRAREGRCVEGALVPSRSCREPDFPPVGRPGEPALRAPFTGQSSRVPVPIHNPDGPAIIASCRMEQERDLVSLRRYTWTSDPASGLEKNRSERVFEPELAIYVAGNGERGAVRRPVGGQDVRENLPRR